MSLRVGDRLGPFEILAPIGAGGMGEVYRARDTNLKREVALKVLPEAFARDPERMARFQREAEVLASLNHPNIAAIYGVEERALVMELVEGDSPKGPLPFNDAWKLAAQIAAALEYAHERGIMHRDLKPANIMITPEGVVKLLDFGLAKAFTEQREPSASPEHSPTLTLGATEVGVILGTAAYMAPEQARGKAVDKRADIWSFGVVLYELLTGERLFTGEDAAETLAAVIHKQPDLAKVPRQARCLLEECLQKDPKQRLRDIGDAKRLVESGAHSEPAAVSQAASQRPVIWMTAAAVLFLLTTAALAFIHFREALPPAPPTAQFEVPSPTPQVNAFALSPDGRYLAMSGYGRRERLWVRPIDSLEARELPGTEGAFYPFWSPDSSYIGFIADRKLKKIALAGGEAQILCDAVGLNGGNWGPNGTILIRSIGAAGLARVSAAGGVPTPVTKVTAEGDIHRYPAFLPDGRRFLYMVSSKKTEVGGIYVGSLDGMPPVRLLPDQSSAAYVPANAPAREGHLLFLHGTTLMALPFNLERLQATAEMFPLAQQVGITGNTGHGGFSSSANGTLVYLSGSENQQRELTWLDRNGKRLSALAKTGNIRDVALSPDDRTVAVSIGDAQTGTVDIWLADVARNTISRFTSVAGAGSMADMPAWSSDGRRLAFSIRPFDSGNRRLYWQAANGTGQPMLVHTAGGIMGPYAWSNDGKFIVYAENGNKTNRDIWLLPLEGDRKPVSYLNTPADEGFPQLSPDSRWMAYASDESGQNQVYIQAVPKNGTRVQASSAGGSQPRWRRDGKELFYISADQNMMAVPIQASSASIDAGTPKALFEGAPETNPYSFSYQPTADGQRFLVNVPANEGSSPRLTVVLNWHARADK